MKSTDKSSEFSKIKLNSPDISLDYKLSNTPVKYDRKKRIRQITPSKFTIHNSENDFKRNSGISKNSNAFNYVKEENNSNKIFIDILKWIIIISFYFMIMFLFKNLVFNDNENRVNLSKLKNDNYYIQLEF